MKKIHTKKKTKQSKLLWAMQHIRATVEESKSKIDITPLNVRGALSAL